MRVRAKIDAGFPNYRMIDKIKPVKPPHNERGEPANFEVWPRREVYDGKSKTSRRTSELLGYCIVKGEEYEVESLEGLEEIFEPVKPKEK